MLVLISMNIKGYLKYFVKCGGKENMATKNIWHMESDTEDELLQSEEEEEEDLDEETEETMPQGM